MDEDEETTTLITVGVVLRINYHGEFRHFNEEDVMALAREGVESHYEVVEARVDSWIVKTD